MLTTGGWVMKRSSYCRRPLLLMGASHGGLAGHGGSVDEEEEEEEEEEAPLKLPNPPRNPSKIDRDRARLL